MRITYLLSLLLSAVVIVLGACAGKPGSEAIQPEGLAYRDSSLTHSIAQLGLNGPTQIAGPLNQETSKLTADDMQETSGGGAAKQRLMIVVDGEIFRASFSAAANLTGDAKIGPDGRVTGLTFTTDNAAVQRAVNEGAAVLVAQWSKATEAERAVLEAKIKAQADTGNAIAQAALQIVSLLK